MKKSKNFFSIATFFSLALLPVLGRILPKASPSFREGFSDVASTAIDSVVNISTTWHAKPSAKDFSNPFDHLFEDFFHQKSLPGKRVSLGSGFLVRVQQESGQAKIVVVTNFHVVRNVHQRKGRIHVSLNSGKKVSARVVGWDEQLDLAVLDIDTKDPLRPLEWGKSSETKVGHWALAIGNPFGLGGTFTTGVVSHTQRVLKEGYVGHATYVDRWIQTDTPVNQGSSGGALLNIDGQVIGINTAIFTPTGGSVGIALAIPESIARPAVAQLVRHGSIQRGFLGVQPGLSIDESTAQSLGMQKGMQGVVVDDITKGKSAESAGLKRGDVILRINGQVIKSGVHLRSVIGSVHPGQKLSMEIWRPEHGGKGVYKTLHLITGSVSHNGVTTRFLKNNAILGPKNIEIRQVEKIHGQGIDGVEGPFVVIVRSERTKGDLQKGDVILTIDHHPVHTVKECLDVLGQDLAPEKKKLFFGIARPVGNFMKGGMGHYMKKYVLVHAGSGKKSP